MSDYGTLLAFAEHVAGGSEKLREALVKFSAEQAARDEAKEKESRAAAEQAARDEAKENSRATDTRGRR